MIGLDPLPMYHCSNCDFGIDLGKGMRSRCPRCGTPIDAEAAKAAMAADKAEREQAEAAKKAAEARQREAAEQARAAREAARKASPPRPAVPVASAPSPTPKPKPPLSPSALRERLGSGDASADRPTFKPPGGSALPRIIWCSPSVTAPATF